MSTVSLTVLILTFNEEQHVRRCIESVTKIAERIIVVDSGSTDNTCSLAKELGAEVFTNAWTNHSVQINWALDILDISSTWILRLDADEIIMPGQANIISAFLQKQDIVVAGVTLNRRIYFMGKWIRHGGIYPVKQLRIWRAGKGRCENRWMDEHIIVDGKIAHLDCDFADINLNNITWWITKHNQYASKECIEYLIAKQKYNSDEQNNNTLNKQAKFKRWIKTHVYNKLPLGSRPIIYFFYRYIILLGFLDGWPGLSFHFLQGLWYRFLVDVKIYEIQKILKENRSSLEDVVRKELGYTINYHQEKK